MGVSVLYWLVGITEGMLRVDTGYPKFLQELLLNHWFHINALPRKSKIFFSPS